MEPEELTAFRSDLLGLAIVPLIGGEKALGMKHGI